MFHSGARRLIEVWRGLPEAGRIPMRAAVDPAAFGPSLPQVFLLAQTGGETRFVLAGERAEAIFGPSDRGRPWLSPWAPSSQPLAMAALVQARREARPVVLMAERGVTRQALEIALAPLRGPDGPADRWIGLVQAVEATSSAGVDDDEPLSARMTVGVGAPGRPDLALAALDGRRIA